ncbi:MAG: RDD family protein [Planctomycetota bacterium]|jgi:uncharacterized RDD family membrane protein YckC
MSDTVDSFSEVSGDITPQLENRIISGFWRRSLACFLDGIFIGIVGFILGLYFFDFFAKIGGYGRLVGFCIALSYFGLLNSFVGKGQTIGKKIMKIEVVQRNGRHISLVRSLIRYAILSAPFFLNRLLIPPSVVQSPIGHIIGFVVFGFGGAVIYLYIFNRRTRQSLHDLAVRTYVVKANKKGGVIASPVWKLHFIIVGIWFLLTISFCVATPMIAKKGVFPELLAVQKSIQSTGKVHAATVFVGKSWGSMGGKQWVSTYFHSKAIWKTRPEDYEAAASEVAALVLSEYSKIMEKDVLAITVTYGFDLGIAHAWNKHNFHYSPQEWIEILDKILTEQSTPTAAGQ